MMTEHKSSQTPECKYIQNFIGFEDDYTIDTAGGWVILNYDCNSLTKIFKRTAYRYYDEDRSVEDWSEPMLEFLSELHLLMKRHLSVRPEFNMKFIKISGLPYICFNYIAKSDSESYIHAFYLVQITNDSFRKWMECFNYWLSGKEQRFLGKFFGQGKIISQISCYYYNNTVLCNWSRFMYDINYQTPEAPFIKLVSTLIIPSGKSVYLRTFFKYRRLLGRAFIKVGFYPEWVLL